MTICDLSTAFLSGDLRIVHGKGCAWEGLCIMASCIAELVHVL